MNGAVLGAVAVAGGVYYLLGNSSGDGESFATLGGGGSGGIGSPAPTDSPASAGSKKERGSRNNGDNLRDMENKYNEHLKNVMGGISNNQDESIQFKKNVNIGGGYAAGLGSKRRDIVVIDTAKVSPSQAIKYSASLPNKKSGEAGIMTLTKKEAQNFNPTPSYWGKIGNKISNWF